MPAKESKREKARRLAILYKRARVARWMLSWQGKAPADVKRNYRARVDRGERHINAWRRACWQCYTRRGL